MKFLNSILISTLWSGFEPRESNMADCQVPLCALILPPAKIVPSHILQKKQKYPKNRQLILKQNVFEQHSKKNN